MEQIITSVENPFQPNAEVAQTYSKNSSFNSQSNTNMAPLGLSYADILGPSLAIGIIISTLIQKVLLI